LRGSLRLDDASGARTRTRKLVRGDERRAMHEQLLSAIARRLTICEDSVNRFPRTDPPLTAHEVEAGGGPAEGLSRRTPTLRRHHFVTSLGPLHDVEFWTEFSSFLISRMARARWRGCTTCNTLITTTSRECWRGMCARGADEWNLVSFGSSRAHHGQFDDNARRRVDGGGTQKAPIPCQRAAAWSCSSAMAYSCVVISIGCCKKAVSVISGPGASLA
jgi:hypothetical protein